MNGIIIATFFVLLTGLLAGVLLSAASKIFYVKEDQLFLDLREKLPGANCGGCGYAGCDDYAHAIAEDKTVPCNKCSVGGPAVAKELAGILGTEAEEAERRVSVVACDGRKENVGKLYEYEGIQSCKAAKTLYGGSFTCPYGCMGLGDCVSVCEFDAIHVENGVAVADRDKCTACGKCVSVCPNHLISLTSEKSLVNVLCSNKDFGKDASSVCKVSCIGCGICEKTCKFDAIHVVDNVAVIDYDKCVSCGACAIKCPRHCIINRRVKATASL
ncbi:MAG: RnfABCDGE type electron transport complex subunit B [Lachnospiraceae bacterium]|nr:RnfABCDGE type electron transport complex subunit B [Lachnospiraceae bacterium]